MVFGSVGFIKFLGKRQLGGVALRLKGKTEDTGEGDSVKLRKDFDRARCEWRERCR